MESHVAFRPMSLYEFRMIRKFVVSDPALRDGAPVFEGTGVPVQTLIDYRNGDVPVYEFLVDHPDVRPEDAKKAARWIARAGSDVVKATLDELRQTNASETSASSKAESPR